MGIFERFLGRNPAQHWIGDAGLRLEVDLSVASLCGAMLGEPIERLSALGPPENPKPSEETGYHYFSRGLEIGPDAEGRFDYLLCLWNAPDRPEHHPFPGRFSWKGRPVPIDGRTTLDDVLALFGEPYHVDEDDEEAILRYQLNDVGWELEFGRGTGLRALLLELPGYFSDPEVRKTFGITRPWPPLPGQGRPS